MIKIVKRLYIAWSIFGCAMTPFRTVVAWLQKENAATLIWTLCGCKGAACIRAVIQRIQKEMPGVTEACDTLCALSDDELEDKHSHTFQLFCVRASPDAILPIKAETTAALSSYEESRLLHKQSLLNRKKRA